MMGDKMKISFVLVVSDRSEERRGFCIRTMDKGSVKKGKMEGSGVDWGGVVLLVFLPFPMLLLYVKGIGIFVSSDLGDVDALTDHSLAPRWHDYGHR